MPRMQDAETPSAMEIVSQFVFVTLNLFQHLMISLDAETSSA
jgi:hypothetical protein